MQWRNLPYGFILAIAVAALIFYRDHGNDEALPAKQIAMQMAQPMFGGRAIVAAFTGEPDINLEAYTLDTGILYFSMADTIEKEKVYAMSTERSAVRFGLNSKGETATSSVDDPLLMDGYEYREIGRALVAIPVAALAVDEARTLEFYVHGMLFDPTIGELNRVAQREGWYLGSLSIMYLDQYPFINHAAFVVHDDPALNRLATRLTAGAATEEEKAQRLLDFVTAIQYDRETGYLARETIRNPHQTIISNLGDCGNKVILFASLLEQVGIDYQLIYTGTGTKVNHILVAVEGNFNNHNGMAYTYPGGGNYFLAETTATGFRIGSTQLEEPFMRSGQPFLIQESGKDGKILDAATGKVVDYF